MQARVDHGGTGWVGDPKREELVDVLRGDARRRLPNDGDLPLGSCTQSRQRAKYLYQRAGRSVAHGHK